MSGRQPARNGLGAAAKPSPPAPARQQCSLKTLTLDGSLFDAPATGRPVGGSPKRPAVQAGPLTGGGSKPSAKPRLPPAGAVLLDNGEAESAFIDTLRSHYTRNGTAESFAPKFAKTPEKTYSRNGRAGAAGSGAAPRGQPGGLAHQERALWEEREEELVDAQERRFAQLEDALAARESKREAYLVHRLEATAAKKIEEHRRTQEAAARARQLAVQRVQQLPSLQKARAAAQPASPTAAALQKLARSAPCAAPPGLAAVQQAVAGVSSLSALSTLHVGLESGLGAAAPAAGVPLLGAGRLGWEGKQRQAAAKAVDQVYDRIQAAKAAGTPLLSPLDAAKDATRLAPVATCNDSRRGSSGGTHPAAGQPAGEAAAVPSDGSEAEEAVSLPRSRAGSSLDSGASLTVAEPGDGEAADGPAGAGLGAACEPDQQLAAAALQPGNEAAEQPAAPPVDSEEGVAQEAAQLEKAAGGGGSLGRGRPSSAEEPEQGHVEAMTGEAWSGSQPGGSSIQPSTCKPEEASSGGRGGSRCSEGAEEGGQRGVAAPAAADEEPATAVMLDAEVAAAVAGDAPAAEAEASGAGMAALVAPEAVAQAGTEASLPPDAGPMLAAAQAPEPADQSSGGTAVSLEAAATESLAAAVEVALLGEPSAGGAGAEPAQLEPQPAQQEPEAAGAAAPAAVAAQQDVMTAAAAVELVCGPEEQEAATASLSADESRLAAEPTNKQAAPVCAAEDMAEGDVPVEAPPPGSSEQQAAAVTGDTSEQPSPPCMEAALAAGLALTPEREGAAAAAEVEQVTGEPEAAPAGLHEEQQAEAAPAGLHEEQQAEAAPAGLHEEQHAPASCMEEPAGVGGAAEAQVAAAADAPAVEPSCKGSQARPGAGSPAEPVEALAVEGSTVLQGQASERRVASMAAADSAEAVGLTQRASASLLFGGRSADGAGVDGGMEEGTAQRAAAGASEAGWQAGEAGSSGSMHAPAVPSGSMRAEDGGGAAQPAGGEAGDSEP